MSGATNTTRGVGNAGRSASSLITTMTPYGVPCPPGLFIVSEAECFGTAEPYKLIKTKRTSQLKHPYGCSLRKKKIMFNTNQNGKPTRNEIRSICRTRELRDLPSPDRTLELCEGNCDSDSECSNVLGCFFTDPGVAGGIPGCGGSPVPNVNYCIRPEDVPIFSCDSPPPTPSEPQCSKYAEITAKKLDASGQIVDDTKDRNHFGTSISIYGNSMAVGAPGWYVPDYGGAVYLYLKDSSVDTWDFEAKLELSAQTESPYFGGAVGITSNFLVVGADGDDNGYGSVYVYTRDSEGSWALSQKLVASDRWANNFGELVGVSENLIMVGDHEHFTYFFERDDEDMWVEVKKIEQQMSFYVSDNIVVDVIYDVIRIYTRSDLGQWEVTEEVDVGFGYVESVCASDNYIAVGSYLEATVYMFTRGDGGTWEKTQSLSSGVDSDGFGINIAMSNDLLVVGAEYDTQYAGAVYLFSRMDSGEWVETGKVVDEDRVEYYFFGRTVAASETTAVIASLGVNDTGSVYLQDVDC